MVRFSFVPAPSTEDPLTINDVIQNRGVYGHGSNEPEIGVEDDGSVYELTADGNGGFNAVHITDFAPWQGEHFRRLSGDVTVTHQFPS